MQKSTVYAKMKKKNLVVKRCVVIDFKNDPITTAVFVSALYPAITKDLHQVF